jgi:hypothetical protein
VTSGLKITIGSGAFDKLNQLGTAEHLFVAKISIFKSNKVILEEGLDDTT